MLLCVEARFLSGFGVLVSHLLQFSLLQPHLLIFELIHGHESVSCELRDALFIGLQLPGSCGQANIFPSCQGRRSGISLLRLVMFQIHIAVNFERKSSSVNN